jgi:hypothetical protein
MGSSRAACRAGQRLDEVHRGKLGKREPRLFPIFGEQRVKVSTAT